MKHIFIVNPAAGHGGAETEILPGAYKKLKDMDIECEFHRSLNKQEIYDYVHTRASKGEPVRFYACGGDGTINDVMCGMIGCDNAQLAVVPCGSGNDFVKNISNKKYLLDYERQLDSHIEKIDVIRYNDTYCINMLNIGIDCDVVVRSNEIKSDIIKGAAAYLVAALQVVPREDTYLMRYTLPDGTVHEDRMLLAAIGNGRVCGGGFKSCPKANVDDGLMDVCLVRPVKKSLLPKLIVKYRLGKHLTDADAMKVADYFQCESFEIEPLEDVNVSVDGEVSKFSKSRLEIVRNAINLSIPRGCEIIR